MIPPLPIPVAVQLEAQIELVATIPVEQTHFTPLAQQTKKLTTFK